MSITLSLVSMTFSFIEKNPLPVLSGFQSRDDFLFQRLGWFVPAMNAINSLPSNSRVAFLWESRAYYCEVACSPDVVIDRWWYLSRTEGSVEGIARLLKEDGITHILVFKTGVDFIKRQNNLFRDQDWLLLDQFMRNEINKLEDFGEGYSLYSLN
jgi:hypothetical protein